jgi:hypothetical protein
VPRERSAAEAVPKLPAHVERAQSTQVLVFRRLVLPGVRGRGIYADSGTLEAVSLLRRQGEETRTLQMQRLLGARDRDVPRLPTRRRTRGVQCLPRARLWKRTGGVPQLQGRRLSSMRRHGQVVSVLLLRRVGNPVHREMHRMLRPQVRPDVLRMRWQGRDGGTRSGGEYRIDIRGDMLSMRRFRLALVIPR